MAIDPALFRTALGTWASGVTVITTGRDGNYRGMTASAFSSLSLNPPLILICVDKGAITHPLLESTGAFNVNILAQGQELQSRTFATKGEPEGDGLKGMEYEIGPNGVPRLKDCLAYLDCAVVSKYDGGDHTIFVGEVENAETNDEREPLLFYRGKYREFVNID